MKETIGTLALAVAWCVAGCDLGLGQREARRTVAGTSPEQVVQASQRVLAAEGFDLERIHPRTGYLSTAWRESPRTRVSYAVSASPFVDEDDRAIPGALTLTVTCLAQDRVVGGWSGEYESGCRTRAILGEITRLLLEAPPRAPSEGGPEAGTPPPPEPAGPPPAAGAVTADAGPAGGGDADAGPPGTEVAP